VGRSLGEAPLRLVPIVEDPAYSFAALNALTAADGTFAFLIVPPGTYRWKIDGHRSTSTVMPTASGVPYLNSSDVFMRDPNGYWINESIEVGASHIDDVALMARSGVTVSGIVIFEGSSPAAKPQAWLSLQKNHESFFGGHGVTNNGGKFEITGVVPGEYGFEASSPYFAIAEMTSGSSDLVDGPLIVGEGGVTGVVVRLTSQPSSISGEVRHSSSSIVPSATVVIFPRDSSARKTYGRERLRIQSTRAVSGRYAFDTLPPGDYYVAAIEDSLMARWLDPALFKSIEQHAQRVFLQPGEHLNVNLVKR
jgi:hypothetical protein